MRIRFNTEQNKNMHIHTNKRTYLYAHNGFPLLSVRLYVLSLNVRPPRSVCFTHFSCSSVLCNPLQHALHTMTALILFLTATERRANETDAHSISLCCCCQCMRFCWMHTCRNRLFSVMLCFNIQVDSIAMNPNGRYERECEYRVDELVWKW